VRAAVGERRAIAGEPELPVAVGGQPGDDVEERALVFLRAKHGRAEQHGRAGAGTVAGAQRFAHAGRGRGGKYE